MAKGTLYVTATPIGNLKDISRRALEVLQAANLIVCEDTRTTGKLLRHYKIEKPLESFFEENEAEKSPKILRLLERGQKIVLVSEAGTPTIADPGYRLVKAAREKGIEVTSIPGPSAVVAALSVSGLPTDQFVFVGFLPSKPGKRKKFLESLKGEAKTVVAFESPYRVIFALKDIFEVFGDRQIFLAREMTKIHEEFFRGKVSDAIGYFSGREIKGEIVLVVGSDPGEDRVRP